MKTRIRPKQKKDHIWRQPYPLSMNIKLTPYGPKVVLERHKNVVASKLEKEVLESV